MEILAGNWDAWTLFTNDCTETGQTITHSLTLPCVNSMHHNMCLKWQNKVIIKPYGVKMIFRKLLLMKWKEHDHGLSADITKDIWVQVLNQCEYHIVPLNQKRQSPNAANHQY